VRVSDFGGLAERHVLIELESAIHGTLPELGVGLGQTPKLPIVADEAVDVVALPGASGMESLKYSEVSASRSATSSPRMMPD